MAASANCRNYIIRNSRKARWRLKSPGPTTTQAGRVNDGRLVVDLPGYQDDLAVCVRSAKGVAYCSSSSSSGGIATRTMSAPTQSSVSSGPKLVWQSAHCGTPFASGTELRKNQRPITRSTSV